MMNEIGEIAQQIVSYSTNTDTLISSTLNVLYMNTRSCRYKIDMIESYIVSLRKTIHAIVFTETWLYSDEIFNIYGYQSFHNNRAEGRGGGVSIFVKDEISAHVLFSEQLDISNFLVVEMPEFSIKLTAIYNPGRNVLQFLSHLDDFISKYSSNVVFGDFNINLLNQDDSLVINYRGFVDGNGHVILNSLSEVYATRESNTVKTIIDHVFTDLCKYSYKFMLLDCDADLSDHKAIVLSVNQIIEQIPKQKNKTVLQYDRIDEQSLKVETINNFDNLIGHYQRFISAHTKSFKTTSKRTAKKPYINQEILSLIESKRNLYFAYTRNPSLGTEYRRVRNQLTNKIKQLKKSYMDFQINSSLGNPKKMWGHINELILNRQNTHSHQSFAVNINGVQVSDESIISEAYNEYFINVCDSIIHGWNGSTLDSDTLNSTSTFEFTPVCENQLSKHIDNLNIISSSGIDGISANFLKKNKGFYLSKYTELVNNCIETCSFPDCLKTAKVVPIYKSGLKTTITNYRPVSVLNVASKPFEKILYDQIQDYFSLHNIIDINQFGFVPKSNTMTAVAHLMHGVTRGLDEKREVACVFIDIRKAFDCVHHELLIKKLEEIGFTDNARLLMKSYLSNRTQSVKINSVLSLPRTIKHGVPQGSILGPLLFTLYINDIFKLPLKGKLQLYADDAAIVYAVDDPETLIQQIENDISLLIEYLKNNHMTLNLEKTHFIRFSLRGIPPRLPIRVNGIDISQVNCVKYLGIFLDENVK